MALPTNAAPQSVKVRRNQFGWDDDEGVVVASDIVVVEDVSTRDDDKEVTPSVAAVASAAEVGKKPPLRSETGTT